MRKDLCVRPFLSMLCAALALASAASYAAPADDAGTTEEAGAEAAVPAANVLSERDRALYAEIFDLQERGRFSDAARRVAQLENRILMGWVEHQKLMHPTAYRSRYTELKAFMDDHADHPYAGDVYRLALHRRPKNWRRPQPPTGREWRTEPGEPLPPVLAASYEGLSSSRQRQVRRTEGRIRYLLRRDRPTQALRELNGVRSRLKTPQYDRIRSWIAASYFYNGLRDEARAIADEAVEGSGEAALLGYWTSGLIAWRDGDYDKAADRFLAMAAIEEQDEWLRAAAGFWAGRAAVASGRLAEALPPLRMAAEHPYTFYGELARAQLGLAPPPPREETIPIVETAELFAASPRVERAAALAEVGMKDEADLELRWAIGEVPMEMDAALMRLARRHGLASAELDVAEAVYARTGDEGGVAAGLYPIPDVSPPGGYTVDRAVVFAVMRQESRFRPDARSRVGARGLMQIMPRTASYIANDRTYVYRSGRERLYDPAVNIELGQTYLSYLMEKHVDGDLMQMAVAYNGGPGNLRRWKAKVATDDPLLFLESIPNPESRDYAERVLTNLWVYRRRLGQPAPSLEALARGEWPKYATLDAGA